MRRIHTNEGGRRSGWRGTSPSFSTPTSGTIHQEPCSWGRRETHCQGHWFPTKDALCETAASARGLGIPRQECVHGHWRCQKSRDRGRSTAERRKRSTHAVCTQGFQKHNKNVIRPRTMFISKMSYCSILASEVCPAGRSELPSLIPKSQPNYFQWLAENSRELPGKPVSALPILCCTL